MEHSDDSMVTPDRQTRSRIQSYISASPPSLLTVSTRSSGRSHQTPSISHRLSESDDFEVSVSSSSKRRKLRHVEDQASNIQPLTNTVHSKNPDSQSRKEDESKSSNPFISNVRSSLDQSIDATSPISVFESSDESESDIELAEPCVPADHPCYKYPLPADVQVPPRFEPYRYHNRTALANGSFYTGWWGFTCTDPHRHVLSQCYNLHGPGELHKYAKKKLEYHYIGDFLKGKMHGTGLLDDDEYVWCGEMRNDEIHGFGIKFVKSNKSMFIGRAIGDRLGPGTMEDAEGNRVIAPHGFDEHLQPVVEARFVFVPRKERDSVSEYIGEVYTLDSSGSKASQAGLPHGYGQITQGDGTQLLVRCVHGSAVEVVEQENG